MEYQFSNDKPIYLQLMDVFKVAIVSGELPKGERLESVRDLAIAECLVEFTFEAIWS